MDLRRTGIGLTSCLTLLACNATSTAPRGTSQDSLSELVFESETLGSLLSLDRVLIAGVLVGLALGAGRAFDLVVKIAWRLGFDPNRRLSRVANVTRLLFIGVAAVLILESAWQRAPVFTSGFVLLFLIGTLFTSGYVASALVGIGLTLGRRVRVGDRVTVGEHEGVVRGIGLSRLHLRSDDGSTILVPNRLLNQDPVRIDRARNSVPVRVSLTLPEPITPETVERVRQVACLSPYRAPGSTVSVARSAEDIHRLEVDIQAWSERARRDAQAQLETTIRTLALPTESDP